MKKELKHDYLKFLNFIVLAITITILFSFIKSFDFFKEQEEKSIALNQELVKFNDELIKKYNLDLSKDEAILEQKHELKINATILKELSRNKKFARNEFYFYIILILVVVLIKIMSVIQKKVDKLKIELGE